MRVTSNAWKTKYQPSYTSMPKQIERPISKLHNDQDYASKYDVNCILKDYHWKKSFRILGFQWMNECVFVLFYLKYICFCISSAVCLKYSSFEFLAAYAYSFDSLTCHKKSYWICVEFSKYHVIFIWIFFKLTELRRYRV